MTIPDLFEKKHVKKFIKQFRKEIQEKDKQIRFSKDKEYRFQMNMSIYRKNSSSGKLLLEANLYDENKYLQLNVNRIWFANASSSNNCDELLDLENLFLSIRFWKEFAELNGIGLLSLVHWSEYFKTKTQKQLLQYGFKKCLLHHRLNEWSMDDWGNSNRNFGLPAYFLEINNNKVGDILSFNSRITKEILELEKSEPTFDVQKNSDDSSYSYYYKGHEGKIVYSFSDNFIIEDATISFKSIVHNENEIQSTLKTLLEKVSEHRKMQNLISGPLRKFKAFCYKNQIFDDSLKSSLHSSLLAQGFDGNFIEENIEKESYNLNVHYYYPNENIETGMHFLIIFSLFFVVTKSNIFTFEDKKDAWEKFEFEWLNDNKNRLLKTKNELFQ